MSINGNKIMPKLCSKFYCEKCDYGTSKKSSYDNHLYSNKHTKSIFVNKIMPKLCPQHICEICNKKYKDPSGLWRHKNKGVCIQINNSEINEDPLNKELSDKELIIMLLKQNATLIEHNTELIKNGMHNTINNTTNNNSNNKTFNLQFFLNETCKDALNINDFVSSIKLQVSDLENTGRLGYVEGVSKIILNNLKTLDTHDRPIHCADLKREVLYIKDNDEWKKDTENKEILTKAIKVIANENIKQISEFQKMYPDCSISDSNKNNLYLKIVSNSMSGLTPDETAKNINKIISNVAKVVTIDK